MPNTIEKAQSDDRIAYDELSGEAARIARKIATSFETRRVRIYGIEPLHFGIYSKRSSADAGLLAHLQIEERLAITTVTQRPDPEPDRCETDDGNVSYIEAKPVEHVAQFL